ncbi:MAG: FAD-dependent oxidoreductase [Deltaproteobacteria bacterium]|nr:FAD-dependent oxidoreductase [Deltaproteobacteria bacterium]
MPGPEAPGFAVDRSRGKMTSGDHHEELDAAIIGAGIGGLSAAAVLARAGCRVAVFEAQPHPGGYLVGFSRKGFTFDSSVQWLNNCRPGGYVDRVLGYVGSNYPKAVQGRRVRRYRGGSFDYVLTENPDDLRDQLVRDFPEDAAGIRRLFAECRKLGEQFDILNRRMRGPRSDEGRGQCRPHDLA